MVGFAIAISGSFAIGHIAAPDIDPAALTVCRFALAALVIGAVAAPTMRAVHFAALWRYGLLGGLWAIYFVAMFEALRLTDPVSTGAVFTLTPIMTAGFGWLLLRQVTTPRMALALAIGAVGSLWVIFRADLERVAAFDIGTGELIFLGGCAAHALYTPLIPRLNRGEPATVFAFGAVIGGVLAALVPGAQPLLATDWSALPSVVWMAIAYLGLVTTALTFFLMRFAATRLPSAKVMAYGYLIPCLVAIWEALLGHGIVAPVVWPGVAATLLALLVLMIDDETKRA